MLITSRLLKADNKSMISDDKSITSALKINELSELLFNGECQKLAISSKGQKS